MIINYYKKNITFHFIDCGTDDPCLLNYNIEYINVQHRPNVIKLTFAKNETIAAVGIFLEKWTSIDDWELLTFAYITWNNTEKIIENTISKDIINDIQKSIHQLFH